MVITKPKPEDILRPIIFAIQDVLKNINQYEMRDVNISYIATNFINMNN